jgi:hypothetical protein
MTVQDELATLAVEIADATAMSDIELFCPEEWLGLNEFDLWYNTGAVATEGGEEAVDRAVRYLDLKGDLEHHPRNVKMVRKRAA